MEWTGNSKVDTPKALILVQDWDQLSLTQKFNLLDFPHDNDGIEAILLTAASELTNIKLQMKIDEVIRQRSNQKYVKRYKNFRDNLRMFLSG